MRLPDERLCLKSILLRPFPLQSLNATAPWHFEKKKKNCLQKLSSPSPRLPPLFFSSLRNGASQRLYLDSTVQSGGVAAAASPKSSPGSPGGGGPRAWLDAALSLRVSFCLLLCRCSAAITFVCLLFKLQDGSLRGSGGRQAGVRRWRLGPEQEQARNPGARLGARGRLQAVESAEGADYGFVQPHSRPAELFHRQQIPVHLWRR